MSYDVLAYIDPATGSIIIQSVIAAVVGTTVFFRNAIRGAIQRLLGRGPKKDLAADSERHEVAETSSEEPVTKV